MWDRTAARCVDKGKVERALLIFDRSKVVYTCVYSGEILGRLVWSMLSITWIMGFPYGEKRTNYVSSTRCIHM